MRLIAIFVILIFQSIPAQASKLHAIDRACRRDSCLHVAAAYGLTLTGAELLLKKAEYSKEKALLYSAGSVLLLGVLKELLVDEYWDGRDISSNIIGVAAGAGIFYTLEF